jgi:hypothetical protein
MQYKFEQILTINKDLYISFFYNDENPFEKPPWASCRVKLNKYETEHEVETSKFSMVVYYDQLGYGNFQNDGYMQRVLKYISNIVNDRLEMNNIIYAVRNKRRFLFKEKPVYLSIEPYIRGAKTHTFYLYTDDYPKEKDHNPEIKRWYTYDEVKPMPKPLDCYTKEKLKDKYWKEYCDMWDDPKTTPTQVVTKVSKRTLLIEDVIDVNVDYNYNKVIHDYEIEREKEKKIKIYDHSISLWGVEKDKYYTLVKPFNVDLLKFKDDILSHPLTRFIKKFWFNDIEIKTNEIVFKDVTFEFNRVKEFAITKQNDEVWYGTVKLYSSMSDTTETINTDEAKRHIKVREYSLGMLNYHFGLHDIHVKHLKNSFLNLSDENLKELREQANEELSYK